MKEGIKERTNVEKYTVYEAVDGTQFTFKEDCKSMITVPKVYLEAS
jgi:hypothetical protein